jgi:competence protein ComEA
MLDFFNFKSVSPRHLNTALVCLFLFFVSNALMAAKNDEKGQPDVKNEIQAVVNINTATDKELHKALKGIGAKKAKAIVAYREQNGEFETVDELTKVKGIGKKTLQKIRNQITL